MEFPSGISRNQRKTIIFGTSSGGEEIETRAAGRDQLAISGTPRGEEWRRNLRATNALGNEDFVIVTEVHA